MQAWWLAKLSRNLLSSPRSALPSSASRCLSSLVFPVGPAVPKPVSADFVFTAFGNRSPGLGFNRPSPLLPVIQTRFYAVKDRSRAPLTPVTSKVKKYKLKGFSSFKFRFRTMKDGQIRRWKAGRRHNAHLKTKKGKRRLRRPGIVHAAYAKVIKKLNFCG